MTRPGIPEVHIHYHRPPDRTQVYRQLLVLDHPGVKITFQPATPLSRPLVVDGRTLLEPGSPVVWFTFPDAWHDIGRFHTADGRFTGIYANVLTPVVLHDGVERPGPLRWDTTDLCLDVWMGEEGAPRILDEEELEAALASGAIPPGQGVRAREEALRLVEGARAGRWPPPVVEEWTLARTRRALEEGQSSSSSSGTSPRS